MAEKPYAVEFYYKVKWGFADEFLRLFRKNHYPVLQRQVETGRFLSVTMDAPKYHMTEDARWDYRVTIVTKSAAVAATPADEESIKRELFPDQATFLREEQHRFEILLAHWDLPLSRIDLG